MVIRPEPETIRSLIFVPIVERLVVEVPALTVKSDPAPPSVPITLPRDIAPLFVCTVKSSKASSSMVPEENVMEDPERVFLIVVSPATW